MPKRFVKIKFLFLVLGLVIFLFGLRFSITGAIIGGVFDSMIFSLAGLFIMIAAFLSLVKRGSLEAILIPTGPSDEIGEERAVVGAEQYKRHKDRENHRDVVIVTGEYNGKGGRFFGSQSDRIYRELRRSGVPKKSIILEGESEDSMDNVLYTCDEIRKRGDINEITIVSDNLHARRIEMLFGRAKDKGYVSKDLKIHTYSKGLKNSYNIPKAIVAYIKDFILPLRKNS